MKRALLPGLALALAAAAILVAASSRRTSPPASLAVEPAVVPSLRVGTEAPDIGLASLNGGTVSLAQLRGQPVLLCFVSGTESCDRLARGAGELARKSGASLVGITGMARDDQQKWLARHGVELTLLHDEMGVARKAFRAHDSPTLFVLDPAGRIVLRSEQPLTNPTQIEQALSKGAQVLLPVARTGGARS